MTGKDVIREAMKLSDLIVNAYLSDLEDDDLFLRPAPEMNHIAWQLGHLIASEHGMISALDKPMPELPDGFAEAHSRDAVQRDGREGFHDKQTYLDLMQRVHAGTLAALDATDEAEFSRPAPERMRSYCPTVGAVYLLAAVHPQMHCGQWVPVRRKLGKPVLI